MKLIKSAFWLGLAFMLVGPQIDLNQSVSEISENSIAATGSFLSNGINNVPCTSLECLGTKTMLSISMTKLSNQVHIANQTAQHEIIPNGANVAPFPRPRLVRKG